MTALTGTCAQCGRELSRAARYCPGCGGKVTGMGPAPAKSQPPPSPKTSGATGSAPKPPIMPGPPGLAGMVEMRDNAGLTQMDQWLGETLGLTPAVQKFQEPILFSETPQEFYGALLSGEPLSEGQWQTLLEQQLREARETAGRGGGVWGAFLAGQSCLINGWLFKAVFGLKQAREAITDERTAALVFGTVAHEKWGHGFLSAMTALGVEARQVHLDRLRHARLFSGFQVATPEGVILREKWRAVYNATRFAEEGWATWVENVVRQGYLAKGSAPVRQAEWMADFAVPELRGREWPAARQAMMTLFDAARSPDEARAAMATLEQAEEDLTPDFMSQYGRPPRYILGYGLCWMIERRFGRWNVPAALLLAGNVVYGLATQGVSDVVNVIAASPDLNVNRRLAAIAHLPVADAPGLGRHDFASACQAQLGMNIPSSLKP